MLIAPVPTNPDRVESNRDMKGTVIAPQRDSLSAGHRG